MWRCRPVIPVLFVIILCWLAVPSAVAGEIRVIELKHRPASDVLPLIRPLLGPDDALGGTDYRLIIRTSDRNLKEIERVLEQIDVARQRLRITVEQGITENRDALSQSVTGEIQIHDKARVTLPAQTAPDNGLTVQQDGVRYSVNRRTATSSQANAQTVMTLDGQRTFVRIGQSVPHVKRILALRRHPPVWIQDVEFQSITTGFDVLPRVRGGRVLVEITPRLSSLRDPATGLADFQELATTIETALGTWLDLGEILGNRSEVHREILESAGSTAGERRTVRLKIE